MARKTRYSKQDRDGGGFVAIPHVVLESVAFKEASAHAKALLFDLIAQLRANNNGDLAVTWRLMQVRGWRSQTTIGKAKQELIERGLIFETRKGRRPNVASLYAVTWLALEHCGGKLEVTDASFPRGAYLLMNPNPIAKKNKSLTPSRGVEQP